MNFPFLFSVLQTAKQIKIKQKRKLQQNLSILLYNKESTVHIM